VSESTLWGPECLAVIAEMAEGNSSASGAANYQEKCASLEKYIAGLKSGGIPLPWNQRFQAPHYTAISRATDIPAAELRSGRLAVVLGSLIVDLPHQELATFEAEALRLEKHVDDAINSSIAVPRNHKGIAYSAIGKTLGIPDHRLRNNPRCTKHIARWIAAETRSD